MPDLAPGPNWDDAWGVPAGHGLHHFPFGGLRTNARPTAAAHSRVDPGDRGAPTATGPLNRLVLDARLA